MTLSRHDIRKLGLPLAAMLALLLIAGLLAWGSLADLRQAEREQNTATAAKSQIETRLRQVRNEEQDLKARTQTLLYLQNAGIIGDEKRLDWMEMLREAQRELRLPGMKYEFGPQTALDAGAGSTFGWFSSPLRVQLRLLHEGDLLNFLDRVQKAAPALVIIRACQLSPLPGQGDARAGLAQLGAECDMQWLTVRGPAGKN